MRISRRRFLELSAGTGLAAALPILRPASSFALPRRPPEGQWLAGDFHCHTILSHDVWAGPGDDNTGEEEFYTLGWSAGQQISIAESRNLDFLAITDHDRLDALHLPEYTSSHLVLVPGYEHSLRGGHAGVFVPDKQLLTDIVRDHDGSKNFADDGALLRFLQSVHDRSGVAVLNHPFYGNSDEGEALAWGYGIDASQGFDAVEVWNIGWPARHDTIPFADADNYLSLPWWEREFVSRREAAAVGGSDNHWRSTTAAQGVGQPTTWVYAADRSPGSILDGVRAGRTFIAAEPPAMSGAKLLLTTREDWKSGHEAMVGDEVRAEGPLDVTVRIENGAGNMLRIVSTGTVVAEEPVIAPSAEHNFSLVLPRNGWLRAELYLDRGHWMTALTSPIFATGRAPAYARTEPDVGRALSYGHPRSKSTYLPIIHI